MKSILKFCLMFWLIYGTEGQTAKCDYSYKNHWTTGNKIINLSYYNCLLDTRKANYMEKITRIDGQHRTGHSDADVKWIRNYEDDTLKSFSSIFCQNFPNLEVIHINNAELESIDENSLTNCKNLDQLWLSNNKIRELPEYLLINNSKLTYLWIESTKLTTLHENFFLNQNELKELNLYENQINFLTSSIFRPLVKLEELNLYNNKLQTINPEWFVNLQNLKLLYLNGNQISEIPSKCFTSLKNLEDLWLYENRIEILYSDSFNGLKNLQILSLHLNEISDLPAGVFTPLKGLKGLGLDHNNLTTIHSDSFGILNQLTRVDLEDNKIYAIDEKFIDNTAVSTLNMTNNMCSQLDTATRRVIKPNLAICFDNYQPRPKQVNSCGKGPQIVNRIIGGFEVKRVMYPWIAALIAPNNRYFCGGTLVSNRKVVTAAHCMVIAASNITVLLGVHDLSMKHEAGRYAYAVQSINIHPDWNTNTDTNDADIAVMVLETEVIFSKYIQPICLTDSNSSLVTINEGIVVGYGKDEDPNAIHLNIPKLIEVPIHQNEDCFLKNYILARFSSKRTFCGGTGTGVCLGDSGSGLVVTDGTAYYLRGIVSGSFNNLTYGCDVDTYSIFTNVLYFNGWINSVNPFFWKIVKYITIHSDVLLSFIKTFINFSWLIWEKMPTIYI